MTNIIIMFFVHFQFTTNIYTPCVNVCNNMMVLLASVAFLPCCKLFVTIVSNKFWHPLTEQSHTVTVKMVAPSSDQ